jgi:hypothetical protein
MEELVGLKHGEVRVRTTDDGALQAANSRIGRARMERNYDLSY